MFELFERKSDNPILSSIPRVKLSAFNEAWNQMMRLSGSDKANAMKAVERDLKELIVNAYFFLYFSTHRMQNVLGSTGVSMTELLNKLDASQVILTMEPVKSAAKGSFMQLKMFSDEQQLLTWVLQYVAKLASGAIPCTLLSQEQKIDLNAGLQSIIRNYYDLKRGDEKNKHTFLCFNAFRRGH